MQRRGFLGMIGAALAGATLDPDRLLWVPGAKLISIPAPRVLLTEWQQSTDFFLTDMLPALNEIILRKLKLPAQGVGEKVRKRPALGFQLAPVVGTEPEFYSDFLRLQPLL